MTTTTPETPEIVQQVRLTRREREVANFLPGGHSNRYIAEALHVSIETVKEHMQNIMRKLAVKGRASVAAWVVQQAAVGQQHVVYVVFGDVRQRPAHTPLRELCSLYAFNSATELAAFKLGLEVATPWQQFQLCGSLDAAEAFINQQRNS